MILYKYMSLMSAVSVIKNSSIGFSCLEDLNDPFECASLRFSPSDQLNGNVQHNAFRNRLSGKYGVLSLTRNPLNTLMWAHYGDNHRGVVIGIDIEKAGLNNLDTCVIPAKFGEMIYTSTIPHNILPTSDADALMKIGGQVSSFHNESYEIFKNAFLYKDMSWCYEEEIRVVKNIVSPNNCSRYATSDYVSSTGEWLKIQIQGRPLYCLSIPRESIVEAYFGCETYSNVSRLQFDKSEYDNTRKEWAEHGILTKQVHRLANSWQLTCD